MQSDIKTNQSGYVEFNHRRFDHKGDRSTWARVERIDGIKILTVRRAGRGIVSDKFEQEMQAFASEHGIDFGALACGGTARADLAYDSTPKQKKRLRCGQCGETGTVGSYPFSTLPGSGLCDDCC